MIEENKIEKLLNKYKDGKEIIIFRSREEADEYIEKTALILANHKCI